MIITDNNRRMILRKRRDLGETINAIFEFINLNQRDFYRAVVLLICPIAILGGVLANFMIDTFQSFAQTGDPTQIMNTFYSSMGSMTFIGLMLSSILGYNVVIVTSCVYVKRYLNKETDMSVGAIWKDVSKHFFPILGTQFLHGIMIFVAYFLSAMIAVFIMMASVALGVIAFIGVLLFLGYLFVHFSMMYPIMIIENKSFGTAMSRAFFLVKNNYWITFLLFVVLFIIYFAIGMIFQLPDQILNGFALYFLEVDNTDTIIFKSLGMLTSILASIGGYLVLPVLILGPIFQFLNLVEKKENPGLLSRIESFGIRDNIDDEETY